MKTILFVCTGNTCRSSMAEALFKKMVKNKADALKNISVRSAGTCAWDGYNASEQAIAVLKEKDIDLKDHRTTPLTPRLIQESDLILTMTHNHKMAVLHMCPEAKGKVFTLKEYVLSGGEKLCISDISPQNGAYDIQDPFGQSLEVYRNSAREIEENLKVLIEKIK